MSKYYIARDKNDALYIYDKKPFKADVSWDIQRNTNFSEFTNWDILPEVKWEDKEPKVLTIEESPWIKVENRLPNDKELVFVIYKNKESNELSYGTNSLLNGRWVTYSNNWKLIAWMPIPEFKE